MTAHFGSRVFILAALIIGFAPSEAIAAVTKVACLGASTTSGDGSTAGHHFPNELGRVLGPGYEVKNFGVSGTTVLKTGDSPYWKFPQLQQAVAYQPDIAIFWFGGNDAKAQNWPGHAAEFITDYEEMVHMVQAVPTHPKIYLLLSMVIHDNYGISKTVLEQQVLPEEKKIAADTGALLVNYHDAFITHPEYYPDGVHPNDQGTAAIGKFVADALLAPQPPSDGGMESAALDATGGDGATAPLSTGGDAAATPSADASSLQPPPAPEASDSMGQASTGTSSGASAGSNAGSTAGTVAGNATGSMGAASGALHSASSGSSGCAASASRRGRFEGAASGGLALLVLLGTWLRRSKIQRLDD